MKKSAPTFLLLLIAVLLSSGCFGPKYIPSSYFERKHVLKVKVKPIPAPSHIEARRSQDESGISSLVGTIAKSSRAANLREVFAHVVADEIRNDLQANIAEKIKTYYDVKEESRDLLADIEIKSWGWILPTGDFGIRLGSYQLQFTGTVKVFDVTEGAKEIAHITLTTHEEMRDEMSKTETTRRVKRAVDEFAELTAEFLWRSDGDKK